MSGASVRHTACLIRLLKTARATATACDQEATFERRASIPRCARHPPRCGATRAEPRAHTPLTRARLCARRLLQGGRRRERQVWRGVVRDLCTAVSRQGPTEAQAAPPAARRAVPSATPRGSLGRPAVSSSLKKKRADVRRYGKHAKGLRGAVTNARESEPQRNNT